jgi:hypothetical protein
MTEWTKPDVINPKCVESFPKKAVKEKKTLSKEEKKKADDRRR